MVKKTMNQLEYDKLILQKIKFSEELFKKEYSKAINKLSESESNNLCAWCRDNFGSQFMNID